MESIAKKIQVGDVIDIHRKNPTHGRLFLVVVDYELYFVTTSLKTKAEQWFTKGSLDLMQVEILPNTELLSSLYGK